MLFILLWYCINECCSFIILQSEQSRRGSEAHGSGEEVGEEGGEEEGEEAGEEAGEEGGEEKEGDRRGQSRRGPGREGAMHMAPHLREKGLQ